jgi:hypothetical protein
MTGSLARKHRLAGEDQVRNQKQTTFRPGSPAPCPESFTFRRIGLPVVVFGSRKTGLSAKASQKAGACFSTFQAIVFYEMERR